MKTLITQAIAVNNNTKAVKDFVAVNYGRITNHDITDAGFNITRGKVSAA